MASRREKNRLFVPEPANEITLVYDFDLSGALRFVTIVIIFLDCFQPFFLRNEAIKNIVVS